MMANSKDNLTWANIRLVPALHNRVEFAMEVRRQFKAFQPDMVAVELPATLEKKVLQGVKRLPLLSVVHYEEPDGAMIYLPLEPTDAMVEAIRLALSSGIPVQFIDRDTEGYPLDFSPMPDPYAVTRIGHYVYAQAYLHIHEGGDRFHHDILREKTMAYNLQRLSKKGDRILFVGGLSHLPGLLRLLNRPQAQVIGRLEREGVGIAHLHEDSSREILAEMPFLATVYERARSRNEDINIDRLHINQRLIELAVKNYWKNSKAELSNIQLKVLFKFARNYALLTGGLAPSFYQLIVASRGAADDDFAYEVWDTGSHYAWQENKPGLPVIRLRGEDLFLDEKRIQFHRRLRTMRRRLLALPVKKRKRERHPGEWKRDFNTHNICSYPPEDVVVEGYGRYLQKKALEIKSEENARVEPFISSMMDGLDIRETIRDWTQGKVYVRSEKPLKGKVGSIVVIFDPDYPDKEGNEAYPWLVTWLGEHDQESDMAFYSTPAGEIMDGPGISRCQYGGFMLTYPPMRVYDIWKDPFFHFARNKPERLLMAGLDYCTEKHVLYVSATPPSGWCKSVASRLGKKIIYIPIGIFSPVTLRKIRQFHVLDGHPVRRYAHDYI